MAPAEVTEDYYEILEIPYTASPDMIKQSYRRLAILLHPDKNKDKPDATASFQQLNRAYETLKDEYSRRIYDLRWPYISQSYQGFAERTGGARRAATAMSDVERERAAREDAARELAIREEAIIRQAKAMFESMFNE